MIMGSHISIQQCSSLRQHSVRKVKGSSFSLLQYESMFSPTVPVQGSLNHSHRYPLSSPKHPLKPLLNALSHHLFTRMTQFPILYLLVTIPIALKLVILFNIISDQRKDTIEFPVLVFVLKYSSLARHNFLYSFDLLIRVMDVVLPKVSLKTQAIQGFLLLFGKTVAELELVEQEQFRCCFFKSSMEVLYFLGFDVVPFADNSKELTQTGTFKHDFQYSPKTQGSKVTHVLRPAQYAKHLSFLWVCLFEPANKQLIPLEMFRFGDFEIDGINGVIGEQIENHRHSKVYELVVMRNNTVNDSFMKHFYDLSISLIRSYKYFDAKLFGYAHYIGLDQLEEPPKFLRLIFLVLQLLPRFLDALIRNNRPVVTVLLLTCPTYQLGLQSIEHQPD